MKLLEGTMGNIQPLTEEQHAKITARTTLLLQVGKLLQEGGFGDSSDEEADEDAAKKNRLRRKVTPAAKSQSSDAPAAPPPPQPLAPQARDFMAEKGLDTWETEETTVILECCTEAYKRRLH